MHTRVHTRARTHARAHTHTHMHMHTYIQVRKLVAFERIGPIPPLGTARVDLTITAAMATLHDAHGQPTLYAGKYELIVATSGAHGTQEVVLPIVCTSTSLHMRT